MAPEIEVTNEQRKAILQWVTEMGAWLIQYRSMDVSAVLGEPVIVMDDNRVITSEIIVSELKKAGLIQPQSGFQHRK